MNFPQTTAVHKKLESGLDVLVHEDHSHPVVSLQIWVETGSMHELPHPGAGISHLLEHMVFKGTKSFTGEVLANRVEELGGAWNAYTTYDRTVYYLDGPAVAAQEFLKLLFELVYLPTLPESEYNMERDVIRREIAMGNDDAGSVGWEQLLATAYQSDSRRFPIIGELSRFDDISHAEMVEYHSGRYTFDNSFIVLSGDLNPQELMADISTLAGAVPARRLRDVAIPTEKPLAAPIKALREFPIPMCKTSTIWPIPSLGHPDIVALEILSSVIGGARSSELYQTLREKEELALNLSSWCWTPKVGEGFFSISTEALPDKFTELNEALLTLLKSLDFGGLEDDLKRAKKQTWVSQLGTLTTVSGRASDIASNWFETRNVDFTRLYLEELEKVTVQDLERVANLYIIGRPYVSSSLVPEGFTVGAAEEITQAKEGIQPTREELSNGLPLILGVDHKLPTLNFELIFKGGNALETEEQEGIGSLYSVLLGKGTQKHSAEEFVLALDQIGASLSFSGGNNTFIVSGFCLTQDFEALCELTIEALSLPLFDEDQLEKERSLLLSKIQESAQDPLRLAFWHSRRVLFDGSPYRFSRLGSEEAMSKIQVKDLKRYHAQLISEGQATLSVFGDISEEQYAVIERIFSQLPYQDKSFEIPEANYGSGKFEVSLDKEQAIIVVAYPGATVNCDDSHALEVIQDYLSSMAGPLFTELREERGLAYFVSCNQFLGVNTGMFSFYIGTDPSRKDEVLEELQKLIEKIVKEGISEKELERVKTGLAASNAKQDQTHPNQARAHGLNILFGKGLEHRAEVRQKMQDLTVGEVSECLNKYFSGVNPVITIVSPS